MYCHIQQSIKSVLLEMWDDRYFGSHLVIPCCHMWGVALDQQRGTAWRGGTWADPSAGDIGAPLCCRLCRLSANPFDTGPSPALCFAHSRHSVRICWLIQLSLTVPALCFPPPGIEASAVSVAHHLTSGVWGNPDAPTGYFRSDENFRAISCARLYLWRFQKHWGRAPPGSHGSLFTPSCLMLHGQVMYCDFSHSPVPEMLWQMKIFSGVGLMFSEVLILNSQPQESCHGPCGSCSKVQLWDRKSDQLWPPWRSATNHGFEQHRSVPSDVHFCEQFASPLGGTIPKVF